MENGPEPRLDTIGTRLLRCDEDKTDNAKQNMMSSGLLSLSVLFKSIPKPVFIYKYISEKVHCLRHTVTGQKYHL